DLVEVLVRLGERAAFRRDVAIVKAPEWRANFLEEFKRSIHAHLGDGDGVLALFPRAHDGAGAERIRADAAERMPIGDREAQMLAHRLPVVHLVGIVMMERERVGRTGTLVGDGVDAGEMRLAGFLHGESERQGLAAKLRMESHYSRR